MSDVLLTVSGTIDPTTADAISRGRRPRADYLEMARGIGADLLDYAQARVEGGLVGRLLAVIGGQNALLAWVCWRRRAQYRVIFTDGEQVGIPLAMLLKVLGRGRRNTQHAMIVHTLSVGKKVMFFDKLGIQSHIDVFFVYSTWQKDFIEKRWDVASAAVIFTPFNVDQHIFTPSAVVPVRASTPQICAVGLERRDYPTLMTAVRDLPVTVVIAAASPWSKQQDSSATAAVPPNVAVRKFTQFDLRQLYADSAFMVMPLYNVTFQAGVTAILEAMAMERAVICSLTPGQTDVIRDGETGVYVPPEDAGALRAAIQRLLDAPELAAEMGHRGRRVIDDEMNLDVYVTRLRGYLATLAARAQA